jgi:hypothetical protein
MKFKLKPIHIGIILILVYLGSVVPMSRFKTSTVSLPKENIINYKLTQEQENYAIGIGKTIISFEYDVNCDECLNRKEFLERIALQNKDQIILQEIPATTENLTKLRIVSYYGEKILKNPSENEVWDALCLLMYYPPNYCALREI